MFQDAISKELIEKVNISSMKARSRGTLQSIIK